MLETNDEIESAKKPNFTDETSSVGGVNSLRDVFGLFEIARFWHQITLKAGKYSNLKVPFSVL